MLILEFSCLRRRQLARAGAVLVLASLLGGCTLWQETIVSQEPPPASTGMLSLEQYLAYTQLLASVRPAQQKKVYQQAASAYRRSRTPHNRLRYALTLSVLDSPYGDADQAHRLLEELAAPGTTLPRELLLLVNLQLNSLQQRRTLGARVAILNKAVEDATAKIDALTTIEQKLEQPASGPETMQP